MRFHTACQVCTAVVTALSRFKYLHYQAVNAAKAFLGSRCVGLIILTRHQQGNTHLCYLLGMLLYTRMSFQTYVEETSIARANTLELKKKIAK
jgi:hypothetical protein